MKFFHELLGQAGLYSKRREIAFGLTLTSILIFVATWLLTSVIGLGFCLAILAFAAAIEAIRGRAAARQRAFDAAWPQVFDSLHSGVVAGITLGEQLDYLARRGPVSHRRVFTIAAEQLEQGHSSDRVLLEMQRSFSSRQADLMILLLVLELEVGGIGMSKALSDAAKSARKEEGELGQLLAKQGWVALSAKVALLAPWLIALVLIQLEQNRNAFASELGGLILVIGLILSLFAYFLVNRLGHLPLPMRVLDGN